ncbi:deoxyribonuclease IV [Gorillibacterium massiliense]|uniref:deoxyribonuclease IV n=1 Tax=Gorillibacterium massiliense TaxID=1280390 RepID=UPI0004AE4384|nr:deoxyribonuclease IV [Gorillibacterium massiliense]
MYAGSHISIRHGYREAARTAIAIGANAFQYFPKNPRSLGVKAFDKADAAACAAFCREHGLMSIAHTPYPTNLAATEPRQREMIAASVRNDLEIAEACGSLGVVVHFGTAKGGDPLEHYTTIIAALNGILHGWEGTAKILLENQAGEGHNLGLTLIELAQIRKLAEAPEKIGFCLDTCHLFASGTWNGRNWPKLEEQGDALGYWGELIAIHFNDSRYPTGLRKDRHAPVGKGHIGLAWMKEVAQSPFLHDKLFILETEKGADGTHREEIELVRQLASEA